MPDTNKRIFAGISNDGPCMSKEHFPASVGLNWIRLTGGSHSLGIAYPRGTQNGWLALWVARRGETCHLFCKPRAALGAGA